MTTIEDEPDQPTEKPLASTELHTEAHMRPNGARVPDSQESRSRGRFQEARPLTGDPVKSLN